MVPHVPSPRGVEIAFLAGSHGVLSPLLVSGYEPRRQGGRIAMCGTGFGEFGLGGQPAQQRYQLPPLTELPYLIEDRHRRRYE